MGDRMNNVKEKKMETIKMILLIIIFIILILGVSFAVWNYTFTGNINTIEVADISLELLESNTDVITIENALPKSDNQGKTQEETFDFAISTNTKRIEDMTYTVKIQKVGVDTGYTALADSQIKIYVEDYEGNIIKNVTKVSALSNNILFTKTDEHNGTDRITTKYKLRAWIDKDVNASNWTNATKLQYKFKIIVNE